MTWQRALIGIAIMAGVTYLCRVMTLVVVRKKIENKIILSVLTYIPYTILACMVIPDVLFSTMLVESSGKLIFSTAAIISASVGFALACVMSVAKCGLMSVSLVSVIGVYLVQMICVGYGIV